MAKKKTTSQDIANKITATQAAGNKIMLDDNPTVHHDQPDKNIEAPEFDITTESFTPSKLPEVNSPETAKEAANVISTMDVASLKEELKQQILNELKDEQVKKMELEKERRERETEEQRKYVEKMKQSPDPWVDIIGWVKDSQGVKTELQWNDAFVDYLRAEGITGVDDDAVVQKWVVVLMHDMADRMEADQLADDVSEFAG